MDTASLVQAIGATVFVAVGGGLLAWSLAQRSTPRATRTNVPPSAPVSLISAADVGTVLPHASWTDTLPTKPAGTDSAVTRRAAILSGLQLALVAALLIGGIYLASTVTADQLLHLGR